jgi:hypothetical protein
MTGGFDFLAIMTSELLHLEFLVKERHSETKGIGEFDVKDGYPAAVTSLGLRALPPGTSQSAADALATAQKLALEKVAPK